MIKLKEILFESQNIIVGVITENDDVVSDPKAIDHGDVSHRSNHKLFNNPIKNKWRYNRLNKTVYWWQKWSQTDGELVMDHLKHKYNVDVVQQLLIDVPDQKTYMDRYNKAHDLSENKRIFRGDCRTILDTDDLFSDATIMQQIVDSGNQITSDQFYQLVNLIDVPRMLKLKLRKNPNDFTFYQYKDLIWTYDEVEDIHYFFL